VRHRHPGYWLIIMMACCAAGVTGVARAQIGVAVTTSVAITVSAGSSISNAGTFTVTNTSGSTITISSINLSSTNPGIFSSMTLTGQVPGTPAVGAPSSPDPPGTSNTFDFSALPALPTGEAATFTLSAVASTSVPTPTPVASLQGGRAAYAEMAWPSPFGRSKMPAALLTLVALGILITTGKLRRRHLVMLAMALILAATEVGCGNLTSVTGSSDQMVQTITVSSGGTPTGLPADLGTITIQ